MLPGFIFQRRLNTCCGTYAASDHTTVRHHHHQLGFTVIERKAAGVQFIVNEHRLPILKAAIDRTAKLRCDVARGGTGTEFCGMKRGNSGYDAED
jgi:hypothetical protein